MTFARFISWFAVAAIALLSLSPAHWIWRPPLPQHIDHAIAYVLVSALFSLHQHSFGQRCLSLAFLIVAAALFEVGQHLLYSRHATLNDFVASAEGAAVGVPLGAALGWLNRQMKGRCVLRMSDPLQGWTPAADPVDMLRRDNVSGWRNTLRHT
jgi:hypothetical protein